MNPRLRRIRKLEAGRQGNRRIYVVTAPVDCPAGYADEAIASAGLPPADERDLVVILTRFTDGADLSPAVCMG